MEIYLTSFALILSLFLFLAALFKIVTQSKKKVKLPPGPTRLPLIGNLHHFVSSQPVHRTLASLAKKYGPVMRLQLGDITTIVVSSAMAAKEVLKTQGANFLDRPTFFGSEILTYNHTNIAFSPYDYSRQLRKICTTKLLSNKRVQSLRLLREEEFSKLCRWISSKEGSVIDLTERVRLTVCDIVMLALLGKTTSDLATFISLSEEASGLLAKLFVVNMYPSIEIFRRITGLRGRVENLHKLCDAILENIVNDHKIAKDVSRGRREDLLDVLLKFNEPGHELYLTSDNIKSMIQDLISGGIETSASIVGWAMAEMFRNPRVLKKAQDEVRQVFNYKGFVDEFDLDKLNYLKLIIKETLRMYPPTPALSPRTSHERCEINGYEIPAGTRVMVNVWAIGRNSEYWKEADSFVPERFLENPIDYIGNNFDYLPFSAGKRICPAISFGIANVELPLAMLLYHFDWVLPDGITPENLDMAETFSLIVRKKNPLNVIPLVRNPLLAK